MSKDAPKYAPTPTPKIGRADDKSWRSHWLENYHEPRLVWHRNKWHWAVTKPKELQKKTDKDKKLSSGTTDRVVALQRKWAVVAKIYESFDNQLGDIDPQIARDEAFRFEAVKLFAKHGVKNKQIKQILTGSILETDDIVRLAHAYNISFPDNVVDLLSDEAKYYLSYLPSMLEKSEHEKASDKIFGKRELSLKDVVDEMTEGLEYLAGNPNAPNASLVHRSNYDLAIDSAKNSPSEVIKAKDLELAERLQSGTFNMASSTLADVRKRYITENKWKRERTKSGAKLALDRFCDLHGETTDISDINAKHAYAFAKWMEDELDAANKSIKAGLSYIKGMFSWAITQVDYDIKDEPWGVLKKIGDYGTAEENYVPFTKEQLTEIFNLIHRSGTGRMNRREHLILSILIATGCRLDEAALLCWENINQHKDGWYFVDLTKALVKNQGSKRLLPIPDCLWPLFPPRGQQLTVKGVCHSPDGRLFDYTLDTDGKAARAASQACRRQLSKIEKHGRQVTHSMRGNLKDLLRDAGISKELNNYITGHGQGDVGGDRYGDGHTVELRYEALNKVKHPWIQQYPT